MTTFLTPLTTQMAIDSSLGGVLVILLLVILILEDEILPAAPKRERPPHWLTTMWVAILPLCLAFGLLMVLRLVQLITH